MVVTSRWYVAGGCFGAIKLIYETYPLRSIMNTKPYRYTGREIPVRFDFAVFHRTSFLLATSFMLAASIVLIGCVLSIEPLIPESEVTFDTLLIGDWENESGDHARISSAGDSIYTIEYTNGEGETGLFEARLGRLGEHLILDVWPNEQEASGLNGYLLISGHIPIVLEPGDQAIRTAALDPEVLLDSLKAGHLRLSYSENNDRLILLGSTDSIRSALGAYLDRGIALEEMDIWRKVSAGETVSANSDPAFLCFEASVWPEADELFRRDPQWAGADGAYSIDLGQDRTLWLFGDTWIDPSGRHTRHGAEMIRNSVAIQTGRDPSTADITFYWRETPDGKPASFFADAGDEWYWPGHGIRLGDCLLLFLNRVRSSEGGLGFESAGWDAILVNNPDEAPSSWQLTSLEAPQNTLGVVVGSASVVRSGDHLYAFGSMEAVKSHPMYVVRWPVEAARQGRLKAFEWWAGSDKGWVSDTSSAARWPAFEGGQTELTVHYDSVGHQFIGVQHVGFGPADVALRTAPELTGPWSEPRVIYRPSEYYRKNIMIYAAKAHPQLKGADLVLTYATNTFDFSEHLSDNRIYYPRFVRLTRCR